MTDDDILKDAQEAFEAAQDRESENRNDALDDLKFVDLLEQWPQTYTREDAVRVTWAAGYGPAATDVPAAIRQAMLLMIGHWFENREASVVGVSVTDLPMAVNSLLAPYSLRRM